MGPSSPPPDVGGAEALLQPGDPVYDWQARLPRLLQGPLERAQSGPGTGPTVGLEHQRSLWPSLPPPGIPLKGAKKHRPPAE